MADNSNSNSWTILAPEVKESGVESVGSLSEGQEDVHAEPALIQSSVHTDTPEEKTHPPDPPQVTPLESSEEAVPLHSTIVKEDTASSIPTHVENLTSLTPDLGEQGASGDSSENQPFIDTESFSDSYTHISPAPVSTSLPGALDEEEWEEKSELRKTLKEEFKPKEKVSEDEGLRRRNVSVPTPLYHHGEGEEEEVEEEQFRHPQREEEGDVGLTLNKCIFGALILLGLGTIFFSGVLMDLDDEGDADNKDLKYPGVEEEWNAQVEPPGGVPPVEILDKLAKENQQISSIEAQLQEQEAELKTANLQMDEGTKERLRMEELEAENQRMRGELDKLPSFQKEYEQENERIKREHERLNKDLEALPALQKELENLRDQVMELAQSTVSVQAVTPSAGHEEVPSVQEEKKKRDKKAWDKEKDLRTDKKDLKEDKDRKIDEKVGKTKNTKDHKEWENENNKQGRHKEEGKTRKKDRKQEEAQRWKLDGEKRELKERGGKKEQKEDKKWEKEKHGERDRSWEKRDKGKEDKESKQKSQLKELKEEQEWKGKQKDWKAEKNGKKAKQDSQTEKERKEKSEKKKDWKERKEWGDENERRASGKEKYSDKSQKEKTGKGKKDYHNENTERKEREEKHRGSKEDDKPKSGKQRTEGWKDEKKYKDKNHKKEEKVNRKGKQEASHTHSYSDRKHSKDHVHINYWDEQREKIRHYYGSTEGCADVTACAHAEGLAPVSQQDFETFISGYLTKALRREDQTSTKQELSQLIGEFFTDGVFVHDQIPFSEFVEDVADILEDMADDDNDEDDEELENELEGFAAEAMKKFVVREKAGNEEKRGGSGRKRMKG